MWMCITEITLLYTVTTLIINCTPMQNKVKKKKSRKLHGMAKKKTKATDKQPRTSPENSPG